MPKGCERDDPTDVEEKHLSIEVDDHFADHVVRSGEQRRAPQDNATLFLARHY